MRLSAVIHQFFEKYLPHIKGVSPHSIKVMWFKRNGHHAKSHQNQSEVFDE